MTYFKDLSTYTYDRFGAGSPAAKNVGWLDKDHPFATEEPQPLYLDALWKYCSVLVAPTRGVHSCVFCRSPAHSFVRHGTRLLLGSAEIRVFASTGDVFAAPNLIYHYVLRHHYRPPEEFVRAIANGPQPGSEEYSNRLEGLGVSWRESSELSEPPTWVRFVRTELGVERTERKDGEEGEGEEGGHR